MVLEGINPDCIIVSTIFQLETAGVGFDGKVKPIGRSEQMEIDVFKKDGTALIVIVVVADTTAQPPAAATV